MKRLLPVTAVLLAACAPSRQLGGFSHRVFGDRSAGRRVVILHGVGGRKEEWLSFAGALSRRYQVLVFDQRGHGQSPRRASGYSVDHYAKDLKGLVVALGWDRFALIGHSLGGLVAMRYQATHPRDIERMVIVDVGPEIEPGVIDFVLGIYRDLPGAFSSLAQARRRIDGTWRQRDPVLARSLLSNLVERRGRFVWHFDRGALSQTLQALRGIDYWSIWRAIPVPVLLVRGARSSVLPVARYERMLGVNSRARGVVIGDAGHLVHTAQPRALEAAVKKFLAGDFD